MTVIPADPHKSLAEALHAFQKEAPVIVADGLNEHFNHRFATLKGIIDTIRPVLVKHGLVVSQWPSNVNGFPAMRTRITHVESNEHDEDTMLLGTVDQNPQAIASALTYCRRYSLLGLLNLATDEGDDDANTASGRPQQGRSASATGSGRAKSGSNLTKAQSALYREFKTAETEGKISAEDFKALLDGRRLGDLDDGDCAALRQRILDHSLPF